MAERTIVFDCETAPLPDAAAFLEPVDPPANYKDAAKIAQYLTEKAAERLSKAALDVDLCQVVALSYWIVRGQTTWTTQEMSERDLLEAFWTVAKASRFVGFKILTFDLPVFLRRSLYLGVPAPRLVIDRYRTTHVDLLERLTHNGLLPSRSLRFYCRRFGIPVGETSGADIGALVAAGDWAAVAEHCRQDVIQTVQLAQRLGVLSEGG